MKTKGAPMGRPVGFGQEFEKIRQKSILVHCFVYYLSFASMYLSVSERRSLNLIGV